MCRAARYTFDCKDWEVSFTSPKARLPIQLRSGELELMGWGRRKGERGKLPLGGWARFQHVQSRRWDEYRPISVRIPIAAFMEVDVAGNRQWFNVIAGQFVRGVLCRIETEQRLYVVVMESGPDEAYFEQWPRIVTAPSPTSTDDRDNAQVEGSNDRIKRISEKSRTQ